MNGGSDEAAASAAERRVLWTALALNAAMFAIGLGAGVIAESTGLLADAIDMLADAVAFGIALVALRRGAAFKARAARFNGILLACLGAGIVFDALRRAIYGSDPESRLMLVVASLSLAVNGFVLHLLHRHRNREVHMRATWIFTRADVIASFAVIVSALIIHFTRFRFADSIVAVGIGLYIVKEGTEIIRDARSALT